MAFGRNLDLPPDLVRQCKIPSVVIHVDLQQSVSNVDNI